MNRIIIFLLLVAMNIFGVVSASENDLDQTKRYSQVVNFSEITINRPADKVFPHLINLNSWVKEDFTLEHVSGMPNSEGEILRVYSSHISREETDKYPPHLVKNIRLIPNKLYAFVNPHKHIEPYGDYERPMIYSTAHALTLAESNDSTKVLLTIFIQYETLSDADYNRVDSDVLPKFNQDVKLRWSKRYLPALKRLVESDHL